MALWLQLYLNAVIKDRCILSVFMTMDYGLIESYIYFRVIVLVKSYAYKFIELQLLYSCI